MWLLISQFGCPAVAPLPSDEPHPLDALGSGGCGLEPYDWVPLDGMGAIVASEPVPAATMTRDALRSILATADIDATPIEHGIRTWRIRYRTQDRGVPVEATALIAVPDDTPPDDPLSTVLWLHPTVGFTDACAPSGDTLMTIANVAFAGAGFVLVAPDYLGMAGFGEPSGMLHPYVVPEPTAIASLDALRALAAFRAEQVALDLPPDDGRTVFWGNSEGGAAALWADRYAPYYLPEVDVTAVVAGVPPTDTTGIARWGTAHAGDAAVGVIGYLVTHHDWYRAEVGLTDILTDEEPLFLASEAVSILEDSCDGDLPVTGDEQVEDIFTPELVDAAQTGDWTALQPWGCFVETGDLSKTVIPRRSDAPVLMIVGEADTLVVGEVERAHAAVLCDAGYTIDYLECAGLGHADTVYATFDDQLAWIRARLDGVPVADPCVIGPPVPCD